MRSIEWWHCRSLGDSWASCYILVSVHLSLLLGKRQTRQTASVQQYTSQCFWNKCYRGLLCFIDRHSYRWYDKMLPLLTKDSALRTALFICADLLIYFLLTCLLNNLRKPIAWHKSYLFLFTHIYGGVLAWLSVWSEVHTCIYGPANATATHCVLLQ